MNTQLLVEIGAPVLSAIVSWFLARGKYKQEVKKEEIENKQKELDFYKTLIDDQEKRLTIYLERNEALQQKLEAQQQEINMLKNQIFSLSTEICMNLACKYRSSTEPTVAQEQPSNNKD